MGLVIKGLIPGPFHIDFSSKRRLSIFIDTGLLSNTKNLKNAELIPLIPRPGKFWTFSTRIWLFRSFLKTRLSHFSSLIAFCKFLKTLLWKEIWTDRHSMDHSPDKFLSWLNILEQEATFWDHISHTEYFLFSCVVWSHLFTTWKWLYLHQSTTLFPKRFTTGVQKTN